MTQPATGRSPEDLVCELRDRVDSSPGAMQAVRLVLLSLYQWTGERPLRDEHVRDTIARLTAATNRIIAAESPIRAEAKLTMGQDVKVRFSNNPVIHIGQLKKVTDGYRVVIPVDDPPTFTERMASEIRELSSERDPVAVARILHDVVSEELRTLQSEVRHLVDDQLGVK